MKSKKKHGGASYRKPILRKARFKSSSKLNNAKNNLLKATWEHQELENAIKRFNIENKILKQQEEKMKNTKLSYIIRGRLIAKRKVLDNDITNTKQKLNIISRKLKEANNTVRKEQILHQKQIQLNKNKKSKAKLSITKKPPKLRNNFWDYPNDPKKKEPLCFPRYKGCTSPCDKCCRLGISQRVEGKYGKLELTEEGQQLCKDCIKTCVYQPKRSPVLLYKYKKKNKSFLNKIKTLFKKEK